jgi:hypothetical protein
MFQRRPVSRVGFQSPVFEKAQALLRAAFCAVRDFDRLGANKKMREQ